MVAALARKSGADPRGLLSVLRDEPRVFDSLWYAAFPPVSQSSDIDAILRGES